ncbi:MULTISPECIES: TetR/AcrR family transcriptional regulator [Zoogloea]|jgi:AcrR family transcriptional regulator|uniref:TetR/AcrR family transcriptional regulator n=1 Tax=Zoogloea dura TaxID=2728840 RepID=A0A848G8H7_9RHOO|nr:TetR/AcrR family transcriptional regulator [Zoogloea dura]NML27620.1 TetR/AcrR family transcriptional regulator [Zoogloea dura]
MNKLENDGEVAVKEESQTDEAAPVVRKTRRNRRSEGTIQGILEVTEEIILESGAERISILDVCKAAEISRGTFYRYFASQEELLDAFSRHKRERFYASLIETTAPHTDPDARLEAMIQFISDYIGHTRARRLLIVAPEYAMNWFQRIFQDAVLRFQDVLGIVFDSWDERLGVKLDRELVCELIIRYVLSEQLVPASPEQRRNMPRRIERLVSALVTGKTARR